MLRTSDCDILLDPGLAGSGPDHWQTRWEAKLSTARRVEQASWSRPVRDAWAARLAEAVHGGDPARPIVLVAHSLGVVTVAHAAPLLRPGLVRGAFLVSPADVEAEALPGVDPAFAPIPRDPLPFPSVLVASRTDPHCTFERAEDLAYAWGSAITDAGDVGHINVESGHGPWPEGTMRFAGFLKTL